MIFSVKSQNYMFKLKTMKDDQLISKRKFELVGQRIEVSCFELYDLKVK